MTTNDTTGRVKAPKAGNHLRLPEPAEREPADTTGSNQLTPNGSAHHLTQHPGNPDPRAIAVARAVLEREDPEFVILFGSRARGDYDDAESDIDLMLVTSRAPGEDSEKHHMAEPSYRSLRPGTAATVRAEEKAREAYRRPVPVQLVWITPGEYRINRVYENSLESIAASEGILMPRDPESYSRRDFEDEETGYAHDWTRYDESVEDARGFLEAPPKRWYSQPCDARPTLKTGSPAGAVVFRHTHKMRCYTPRYPACQCWNRNASIMLDWN